MVRESTTTYEPIVLLIEKIGEPETHKRYEQDAKSDCSDFTIPNTAIISSVMLFAAKKSSAAFNHGFH